jgi:hypothetical protein
LPSIALDCISATTDIERQKELLEQQRGLMEQEHALKVQAEIGNLRYHPLDVAGAGTAETFPTDYAFASKIGAEVGELLTQIRAAR